MVGSPGPISTLATEPWPADSHLDAECNIQASTFWKDGETSEASEEELHCSAASAEEGAPPPPAIGKLGMVDGIAPKEAAAVEPVGKQIHVPIMH